MEQTKVLPTESNLTSIAKTTSWFILAISILSLPLVGSKISAIGLGFSFFLIAAFAFPLPVSIMLFFPYLFFDGAIKILSNYHPVVHVGQDLFLLALITRVIADPNRKIRDWFNTPFIALFILFFCSVLIQYLNPFGLGLLPSIAGTKVYFSGIFLFFLVYHYLHSNYRKTFFLLIVSLGLLQCILACTEYLYFPEQIFTLHPKYRQLAGEEFVGSLYRPFGTTSAPGAPSLWVFLCTPFAYLTLTENRSKKAKLLALSFFVLAIPTLIFCQTRAAMVLFALSFLASALAPNRKVLPKILLVGLIIGLYWNLEKFEAIKPMEGMLSHAGLEDEKAEGLEKRLQTLFVHTTYKESRQGALIKIFELAGINPLGIGLSRVGAAAAVWYSRIKKDPYFGEEWAFADNVYRAIFTELGIFGLLSWIALILSLSFSLMRKSYRSAISKRRSLLWICGITPIIILVGGLGSEGILYMPVGAFLWVSLAIGLRESEYV